MPCISSTITLLSFWKLADPAGLHTRTDKAQTAQQKVKRVEDLLAKNAESS